MASPRSAASFGTGSLTDARKPPIYAVVLAGGSGTRLWPLGRVSRPKPFLDILPGETLFQQACRRGASVAGRNRVVVVIGRAHIRWVRQQAPWISPGRIIVEGAARNTAASVALAAHWIRAHEGDGVMVAIPSDHWIAPLAAFRRDIHVAASAARRDGALVTMGVPVRSADTGFGYIQRRRGGMRGRVSHVESFVEKPAPALARRLARDSRSLWNSGIFIWKASSILSALECCRPRLARDAARAVPARVSGPWRISARAMQRIEAAPIDTAVLERTDNLFVMRATFAWSDLGNWNTLAGRLPADRRGNRSLGSLIAIDSSDCVVIGHAGLAALVGVRNLVVVQERGVVLVCARDSIGKLRSVQQDLRGRLAVYA